jgi:hypothetical protein
MGYLHIDNLYKNQDILMFRECYAMEKIHGTSAHIKFHLSKDGTHDPILTFFSGGESHDRFVKLFDKDKLLELLKDYEQDVEVYGEAYGGKQQGMSGTYGKDLKFIVFDVKVNDMWLSVPNAHEMATHLGLEFVHYVKVATDVAALDAERDADSTQAIRNGVGPGKMREGVVLRPLVELTKNNGGRIIVKHKRDEFRETAKPRELTDPTKLAVLSEAQAVADEWVTQMRLSHVLDKLGNPTDLTKTPDVIKAMIEDVKRESVGEVVWSKEVEKAVSKAAAAAFKTKVQKSLTDNGVFGLGPGVTIVG